MAGTSRQAYLDALGIQTWRPREAVASLGSGQGLEASCEEKREVTPVVTQSPAAALPEMAAPSPDVVDTQHLSWDALQAQVAGCTRCNELASTRTQTVFGVGNRQAEWLVIGEAPGAEEDRLGEPFVGRAGQLLNNMLKAIGLQREAVYIANMLKCRPPVNRDPHAEEVANCADYLKRQVELVAPNLILVVGRIAAQNLLKSGEPLARLRGKIHHYGDIPLVVTYHPAYLLRTPSDKAKAWADLRFARDVVEGRRS